MARGTYDQALDRVLEHEGGYTNDAADPGGPTNWGITIHDARMYWKPDATAEDVRRMPLSVAKEIYRKHYADPIQYDKLPAGVDYAVLDYGINSGIGRSARVLQRFVGVPVDGKIGLVTLTATRKVDPARLIDQICDERMSFLQRLRTWPVFGKGWARRVRDVRRIAKGMVGRYVPEPLPRVELAPPSTPASREKVEESAKAPTPLPPQAEEGRLPKSRTLWGGAITALGGAASAILGALGDMGWPVAIVLLVLIAVGVWMVWTGRVNVQNVVDQLKSELGN